MGEKGGADTRETVKASLGFNLQGLAAGWGWGGAVRMPPEWGQGWGSRASAPGPSPIPCRFELQHLGSFFRLLHPPVVGG